MKIIINGQFTARKMTGQERFAFEVVKSLDKIISVEDEVKLVVPTNARNIPPVKNIRLVKFGKVKGFLWEQMFFFTYCIFHKGISLNLCSIMPILKPGIICIHDISYKVNPQYFKTLYARLSQLWHKVMFHLAKRFSPIIFTVSEFSKRQMVEVFDIKPNRIIVVPNGWQHFEEVKPYNGDIEEKYPMIRSKEFFFSLGSLAPNKNIDWIFEVAKQHPQYEFLIAGNANMNFAGKNYSDMDLRNVSFLGYISDSEIKTLMQKCKAFIFPSFFEGFGIPPLEALSVGAEIIVAKSSCLPEIFQNSAHYVDPYNTIVCLDEILKSPVSGADKILKEYDYSKTAHKMYEVLG